MKAEGSVDARLTLGFPTFARAHQVSPVGSFLDLPRRPPPIGLVRSVLLDELLKAKPERRVPGLRTSKEVEASIDLLARHRWFETLDSLKILLVKGFQAVEPSLDVREQRTEFFGVHSAIEILPRLRAA